MRWLVSAAVSSALLLVGFAAFSQSSASAEVSALQGHILFTRAGGRFGDETLYVSKADGTSQRRLSEFGRTCCPWATRSGSRIVYGGTAPDTRITAVTASLDGSKRTVLPLPKGTLELASGPFSPDGKTLAREGIGKSSEEGIYLTRASDGKIVRRVTRKHFIPGDFSPDGRQLVIFAQPDGGDPRPGSLWLVRTNGKGLHRLTPAATQVQCCGNYRWSPDGKKILFADAGGVLWTIAPDGSKLTEVFRGRQRPLRDHSNLVARRLDDHVRARSHARPVRASREQPLRHPRGRERSYEGARGQELQALARLGASLAQPARLELALFDPQLRRKLGLVAPHLLDEPLSILAPDEHLELDAKREVG